MSANPISSRFSSQQWSEETLDAIQMINSLASKEIPFLFLIDFELKAPLIIPLSQAHEYGLWYDFLGESNGSPPSRDMQERPLLKRVESKDPEQRAQFKRSFNSAQRHLQRGDVYLINITQRFPIKAEISLSEIYSAASAPYKILYKDLFAVFSPEAFVSIKNNTIDTYPMKGTQRVQKDQQHIELFSDPKEVAEHATVVDLLRNDLSIVASQVAVENFKFQTSIETSDSVIVQTSSKISGKLLPGWQNELGQIIFSLLPAGSISGAPKCEAVRIIQATESEPRGYYTGIGGIYRDSSLTSAVLIRFVEKDGDRLYFRSGVGITTQSVEEKEFNEMLDKIALPHSTN